MDRPLISVIIPVYNAKDYLPRCIGSLTCQLYKNLEIILVDDGSTDGSAALCDQYARKDPRICVYHLPNRGPAIARNHGLDNAHGEWIAFVDSDDRVLPNHISSMYSLSQDSPAVIVSDISRVDLSGEELRRFSNNDQCPFYRTDMFGYVHNKLYHREHIAGIRFPDIRFAEDWLFNLAIYRSTPRYLFTGAATYVYYQTEGSLSSPHLPLHKIETLIKYSELSWVSLNETFPQDEARREFSRQVGNDICDHLCCACVSTVPPLRERLDAMAYLMKNSLDHLCFRQCDGILLKTMYIANMFRCPFLFYVTYRSLLFIKQRCENE